jgi:nitrogen regulatory protein PII
MSVAKLARLAGAKDLMLTLWRMSVSY